MMLFASVGDERKLVYFKSDNYKGPGRELFRKYSPCSTQHRRHHHQAPASLNTSSSGLPWSEMNVRTAAAFKVAEFEARRGGKKRLGRRYHQVVLAQRWCDLHGCTRTLRRTFSHNLTDGFIVCTRKSFMRFSTVSTSHFLPFLTLLFLTLFVCHMFFVSCTYILYSPCLKYIFRGF